MSSNNEVRGSTVIKNQTGADSPLSGGSGGLKNYLSSILTSQSAIANVGNGDFELGTTAGWSLGTVGTLTNGIPTGTPTFGSGASGNLSIAIVSSSHISGRYSLSYASSAATTQGNMLASNAFNIDTQDQAKVLGWKFAFKAQVNPTNGNWSGTSSNSFAVAAWDVTNGVWLPMTGQFSMVQSNGIGIASGNVQTNPTTTQIRFVVYNANASAGAITVYFDDFQIGPNILGSQTGLVPMFLVTGTGTTIVSSGQTVLSWSSLVTDNRAGFNGTTTYTVPVSGYYDLFTNGSITIPSGSFAATGSLRILRNGSSIASNSCSVSSAVGNGNSAPLSVRLNGYRLNAGDTITVDCGTNNSIGNTSFSGAVLSVSMLGSSLGNDDGRVVAFSANGSGGTVGAGAAALSFNSLLVDTHAGFNGTTTYTVPLSGIYRVRGVLSVNPSGASGGTVFSNIYKNGVSVSVSGTTGTTDAGQNYNVSVEYEARLNAGDTLTYVASQNTATTMTIVSSYFAAEKLNGPSVVTANETVSARYYQSVSQSIPTGGAVPSVGTQAGTVVNFEIKDHDTHNAVTVGSGWNFVAPRSGYYLLTAMGGYSIGSSSGATAFWMVNKNGQLLINNADSLTTAWNGNFKTMTISEVVKLNAGDVLNVTIWQNTGSSQNTTTASYPRTVTFSIVSKD